MSDFLNIHSAAVIGTLSTFDRMIFKGHLTRFFPRGAFTMFLLRQGVLLKDFGSYVERVTGELKAHGQKLAAEAGRPFEYLASAHTAQSGESKEDRARAIAERDGSGKAWWACSAYWSRAARSASGGIARATG